jgi:pyridoxine kinase
METSAPHQTKGLQDTSVLSIQSWVCHGYVGNRCSVFALQLLGIEVDAINTVNFSNHTGYPSWKGQKLDGDQLYELFDGLVVNVLAQYSHLLTGYISTPSSLRNVMKIRSKLKEMNPNLIYGKVNLFTLFSINCEYSL